MSPITWQDFWLSGWRNFSGSPFAGTLSLGVPPPTVTVANTQSFTAGLSLSGGVTKQTNAPLAGALAFTGRDNAQTSRGLSASLGLSGNVARNTGVPLAGGLSFVGSQFRVIGVPTTGSLSFVGNAIRTTLRGLTGTLTPTGQYGPTHIVELESASLSPSGTLQNSTGKSLSGGLSATGTLSRAISHGLTGSLSFGGLLARAMARSLSGTLGLGGSMAKQLGRPLPGGSSFTGAIVTDTFSGPFLQPSPMVIALGSPAPTLTIISADLPPVPDHLEAGGGAGGGGLGSNSPFKKRWRPELHSRDLTIHPPTAHDAVWIPNPDVWSVSYHNIEEREEEEIVLIALKRFGFLE